MAIFLITTNLLQVQSKFLSLFLSLSLYISFSFFVSAVYALTNAQQQQIKIFQNLPKDQQQQLLGKMGANPTDHGVGEVQRETVTDVPQRAVVADVKKTTVVPAVAEGLRRYGYDLFAGEPTTFEPVTDIPIPSAYIVGPGDKIQIKLYGRESQDYELEVSRRGTISLQNIGPISVAGLDFENMRVKIKNLVKKQYIGVKAEISLGELRSMRVFVLGHAYRPGSYSVSSLSTITHALYLSGGVAKTGSLRNILLKRDGKIISTLDLYQLLMEGDTSGDRRLQSGDTIFIPAVGSLASIDGEVVRPAIYEMLEGELMSDLLHFGGGNLPTGKLQDTWLERINTLGERLVINLDLTHENSKKTVIKSGDKLHFPPIYDNVEGVVMLYGEFKRPGPIQIKKDGRLSSLFPMVSQVLKSEADPRYLLIKRKNPLSGYYSFLQADLTKLVGSLNQSDEIELQSGDELYAFGREGDRNQSIEAFLDILDAQSGKSTERETISVYGHVRFPGRYPLTKDMRISDLVLAAGSWEEGVDKGYALLERSQSGKIEVISIELSKMNESQDLLLVPEDRFYLFGQKPLFPDEVATVIDSYLLQMDSIRQRLKGQGKVEEKIYNNISQKLEQSFNKKLDQIFKLTELDDNNGQFKKEAVEDVSSYDFAGRPLLDPLLDRLRESSTLNSPARVVTIGGQVRFPGIYPLTSGARITDLVKAAGSLTSSGYDLDGELTRYRVNAGSQREISSIKINLAAIMKGEEEDIVLHPYDSLVIKTIPGWGKAERVKIEGEVLFPGTYIIKPNETLLDILERAGGVDVRGDLSAAIFMRKSLQAKEKKQLETLHKRLKMELAGYAVGQSSSGSEGAGMDIGSIQALMDQLSDVRPAGRLVVDLPRMTTSKKLGLDYANIKLWDGDFLFIPKVSSEVSVIGEVNFPTSHLLNKEYDTADYINLSGGLSRLADDERIYVVKANGSVVTDVVEGWFNEGYTPIAGDTIVISQDLAQMRPLTLWTSISQVVYQLGIAVAAWQAVGLID